MSIRENLVQIYQQIVQSAEKQTNEPPRVFFDEQWPSPCEIEGTVNQQSVAWQQISQNGNMKALADALEVQFPESLIEYFGSFYSDNLVAKYDDHHVCLLQAWSEEDFDRLLQNITGHVLMKRRLKQADTVFFATTEEEDLLIVMKISDGSIWLEYLGKEPHHQLANTMDAFLTECRGEYFIAG